MSYYKFGNTYQVVLWGILLFFVSSKAISQLSITSPKEEFGFNVCDDHQLVTYTQFADYWRKLDKQSDRVKVVSIGKSEEGREQWMAIITSPANFARLEHFRDISIRLARAKELTDENAKALAKEGRAVVWIDGGLHSTEYLVAQELVEHVYRMASRSDEEILRILDNVIQLIVLANPDGLEQVATAYMNSSSDPKKRGPGWTPTPYQKYVGHDNNRDLYLNAMAESKNMSRILYREWIPQIVCDHHQAGDGYLDIQSTGSPYNYYLDPLALTSLRALVGSMSARFVAENKPGVHLRNRPGYLWSNGFMSTTPYFHNQIGLVIETEGDLEPKYVDYMMVPWHLISADNMVQPFKPQIFRFRDGMEYDLTANMGILNYACRMREELLYNIYLMGHNSIQRGSEDSWTITSSKFPEYQLERGRPEQRQKEQNAKSVEEIASAKDGLLKKVFFSAADRDARAYVLPSDQPDFLAATRFINSLIESGVEVWYNREAISFQNKNYPAGSYVIKTAQAFRPHVLDMFEPQIFPSVGDNGEGPVTLEVGTVDVPGYTLALQMGIKFDRILDSFPCTTCDEIKDTLKRPPLNYTLPKTTVYSISRKMNESFRAVNRLTREGQKILVTEEYFYVPSNKISTQILSGLVEEKGLQVGAATKLPVKASILKKPMRVGLLDYYGGKMSSGWIRWLFEQFEFSFELVYPSTLDSGDLSRFDALVLPVGMDGFDIPKFIADNKLLPAKDVTAENKMELPDYIPEEHSDAYFRMNSEITQVKTISKLKEYVSRGGRLTAIGSSVSLAQHFNLPITDYLVESTEKGVQSLPQEKFNIYPSLLQVSVDNNVQPAFGMDSTAVVVCAGESMEKPVVMQLPADAGTRGLRPVAWFSSPNPLRSGWMIGSNYLQGGVAAVQANYGKGVLYLFGPEITFRGQSQGTLKFLFNSILGN
jgi:hypothetical protein